MGIALKHLSESERIRIAEQLFKITTRDLAKGELHGLCPIHAEKNPSFSYNFKKDNYHCFSCSADGDLLKLWSEVHGYGQKEGFKAFCDEYDIKAGGEDDHAAAGKGRGKAGDIDAFWEMFPPLPETRIKDLVESRGWTPRIIEMLDLRLQTFYADKKTGDSVQIANPDRIAIPVRDSAGTLRNIRLYKPGGGQMKIMSWGKSYGQARLFPAAFFSDAEPVLLCEGESDTICALSNGFNAITQTSKTKSFSAEHLKPFKNRDVIIAYDADKAGQQYARYAAQSLFETAKSVRILTWPQYMMVDGEYPENHGQDLTDFFVRHEKKPKDLEELFALAKPYDPATDDTVDGPRQFFDRGLNDRFSFKPRMLAEKILSDMSVMFNPRTGLMYRYNGKLWEEFDEEHIKTSCIRYLGNEAQKARVEDSSFQVRMLSTIPHGRDVNDQTEWICVNNGMLNLHTLEMKPHDRNYFSTYILPVEFDPEKPSLCDRWKRYLEETVQTSESIAQLQEFAGYCLIRSAKFEKCLILIGPGADGKSTFLKIMKEMVGEENCASVSFADLEDQFHRSSLYGKLLNISTEAGAKAIESPYFKAITSGDPINAAYKHKDAFTFSPYCKLAFASNRLPRVLDNSDGFFRRVLPITFKRQFLTVEERDADLFDTLKGELSGIFSWAIFGLHRLLDQKGFTDCPETRDIVMDYRRINNPVLCFVEDECMVGESYEISKETLFSSYKEYCKASGYSSMHKENFFRELYVAVHNIKQYRPRMGAERPYIMKGITVGTGGSAANTGS